MNHQSHITNHAQLIEDVQMNIFEFMAQSPILTFFLALIAANAIHAIFAYCINRPLRHRRIMKYGWPPKHCDADGDFKDE